MNISRFTFVFLVTLFFNCLGIFAKTVKDTLMTSDGDRIIVTYEITHSANRINVRFNNQLKKLGSIHSSKYRDVSKVAVMFFDRTGGFDHDVSISNMVPEAFMIPDNVNYKHSSEGFFIIQDNPELSFTVSENSEITIPLYLAYHPKKGKYILFSKSKGLKIDLTLELAKKQHSSSQVTKQTFTSTMEVETDNTGLLKILESLKYAKDLLEEADKLPFSETLLDEISFIRQQKREITDAALLTQITDVLNLYEERKTLLEERANSEQIAIQREAEEKAKREAEALQAKNDSIQAVQQEQAEKDKERNMWMIIAGVGLAALAFIGNQILQHYNNAKNQRKMMDMQQDMTAKAEEEAKRRARNAVKGAMKQPDKHQKIANNTNSRKKTTIKINGKSKDLSI